MNRLGRMIGQLAQYKDQWEELAKAAGALNPLQEAAESRLSEVAAFGSNPGNLRMLTYVPARLAPSPALVVVLHGCTQTAAGYDHGAGWSTLADRYGFALLFPEQQDANNPKRCFNWFQTGDTTRGRGEAASIRQMVDHAVRQHGIDPGRVFVTGLSAGGAMTAAMLATYPDVFAGGAIVAGLPYGGATTVAEAFDSMFQGRSRSAREWGDLVRAASRHQGPWPRVSVWHGSADATVKPMNAREIIKQWTDVHGLSLTPSHEERVDGHPRRTWSGADGRPLIEEYIISGMAHGTPLATGGEDGHGAAGPFLLEAGISSSFRIAEFWGLTGEVYGKAPAPRAVEVAEGPAPQQPGRMPPPEREPPMRPHDIGSTITKALRAAGLMR